MTRTLREFADWMGGQFDGLDAAVHGVSTDSRTLVAGQLFFALGGPNFDAHDFVPQALERGAVGVVVSKKLPLAGPQIVVSDTLAALQRAAACWRAEFDGPVIAVAGSNGKTTTKEMLAAILAAHGPSLATRGTLNNHIGVPLTLLGLSPTHEAAVIEIGANHPGEVAALTAIVHPTVAVVTNAGAEHLEGFGDLDGVARAEGELFVGLAPNGCAAINADDEYASLWIDMVDGRQRLLFGTSAHADVRLVGDVTVSATGAQRFDCVTPAGRLTVTMALLGRHNVLNALAAIAAAQLAGVSQEAIVAGLAAVKPAPGRLQLKQALCGAVVIDDSYNANPSSLSAALAVIAQFSNDKWLVIGEMGELGAVTDTAHVAAGVDAKAVGVKRLFGIGSATAATVRAFGAGAEWFEDMTSLIASVSAALGPDVLLLVKGSRSNRLERLVASLCDESVAHGSATLRK
jgi:UDP-N-acetylmuramoyl-tripeptide--D-alanyl-D-alanine ligase